MRFHALAMPHAPPCVRVRAPPAAASDSGEGLPGVEACAAQALTVRTVRLARATAGWHGEYYYMLIDYEMSGWRAERAFSAMLRDCLCLLRMVL